MVILPRSCHDLVMILTSVPCIMISHDLEKRTMVNHDLARLTMILASVACLRLLGYCFRHFATFFRCFSAEVPVLIFSWNKAFCEHREPFFVFFCTYCDFLFLFVKVYAFTFMKGVHLKLHFQKYFSKNGFLFVSSWGKWFSSLMRILRVFSALRK